MTSPPIIAGHTLIRELGRGGMGVVYLAEYNGQQRALKMLLSNDVEMRSRFLREAQAVAAVDAHPNIARVFSVGEDAGRPYISFEFIEGQSLDNRLKQRLQSGAGPYSLEQALELLRPISKALGHVHSYGILHRDLKPANILIRESDGQPLLADFGLAHRSGEEHLTRTGEILGTPAYMAPEQIEGAREKQGPWTDIWALAVIFFELLTLRPLFQGATPAAIAALILQPRRHSDESCEAIPEASRAPALSILRECLKIDSRERPQSLTEFLQLLNSLPPVAGTRAPAKVWLGLVAFIVVAALAGAYGAWPNAQRQGASSKISKSVQPVLKDLRENSPSITRAVIQKAFGEQVTVKALDKLKKFWGVVQERLDATQRAQVIEIFQRLGEPEHKRLALALVVLEERGLWPQAVATQSQFLNFETALKNQAPQAALKTLPELFGDREQQALSDFLKAYAEAQKGDCEGGLKALDVLNEKLSMDLRLRKLSRHWRLQVFLKALAKTHVMSPPLNEYKVLKARHAEGFVGELNQGLARLYSASTDAEALYQVDKKLRLLKQSYPEIEKPKLPKSFGLALLAKRDDPLEAIGCLTHLLLDHPGMKLPPRFQMRDLFGWLNRSRGQLMAIDQDDEGAKRRFILRAFDLMTALAAAGIPLHIDENAQSILLSFGLLKDIPGSGVHEQLKSYWFANSMARRSRDLSPSQRAEAFRIFRRLSKRSALPTVYQVMMRSEVAKLSFNHKPEGGQRLSAEQLYKRLSDCYQEGHPDPSDLQRQILQVCYQDPGKWPVSTMEAHLELLKADLERQQQCLTTGVYKQTKHNSYFQYIDASRMNGRVIRLESHRGVVHYFKGETQAAIKLLEKHLESLYIKKWTPEYLFLCYLKVRNFKAAKKLIVYATRRFSRSMGERFGKQLAEAQQEKN